MKLLEMFIYDLIVTQLFQHTVKAMHGTCEAERKRAIHPQIKRLFIHFGEAASQVSVRVNI